MDLTPLFPRQQTPSLNLPTVDGDTWTLSEQAGENFTMVVFYRGFHCPICAKYLRDLNSKADEFAQRGVNVVVASSDVEERARKSKESWKLDNLTVAYDLDLDKAREWGLYISTSRGKTSTGVVEPDLFSEPALYLIRPDGTLYASWIQTVPFARPKAEDLLSMIKFVLDKDYPPRGVLADEAA